MAVIKDYYQGQCHIIVHDDYIRPPEEVQKIIDRVSEIVYAAELKRYMEQLQQGQTEKTEQQPEDDTKPKYQKKN